MIGEFKDKYRFLSNFWPCVVVLDGLQYKSVEHAFVASKTTDPKKREVVRQQPTASMAKRYGKTLILRDGWNEMKRDIMEDLIRQKFQDPVLKAKLLETGDEQLIEGNTWGDVFWGVTRGVGLNHLGKILMKVRDEIRQASQEAQATTTPVQLEAPQSEP